MCVLHVQQEPSKKLRFKLSNMGGGGFLQLLDWNSKTRKKKPIPRKSDFLLMDQSNSKQKKRTEHNLLYLVGEEDDESVTTGGGGGYSCASSTVINDEDDHGYGIKAPSVIARLMGLDSLPTPNFEKQQEEEETPSLVQKFKSLQPIEKFQTETLSRKSAKSIPITQHKLLSPIKSPGFVPSYKDAAQIMEAVTKIIEPALQLQANNGITTTTTTTTQKVVKPPLKTKDLKEKAAAAASSSSSNRRTRNEASSSDLNSNKKKSVSLALQAKVNVQRREGILRQISNNISSQPPKKKTSSNVVLKQNNQKQNCHSHTQEKDDNYYLASNNSTSQCRRRSSLPLDSSLSLRKFNQDDDDKQSVSSSSSSITKTVSRKKRLIGTDKRNYIVSFTFTTPMKRSSTTTTTTLRQQTDDLSALLEQKLRELTNVAQSSSVSKFQDREKIEKKTVQRFPCPNYTCSTSTTKVWELEYVEEILSGVELMIEDYAIGRSKKIINPHLFHQIEIPTRGDNQIKKLLFDCVGESMELRCMSVGGWKAALSFERRRSKTLAEEVYEEISGWRIGIGRGGAEDSIVDDLVDRDMSGPYGKWLDFEIEIFQIGVEIQGSILNTLFNQVIADMIASYSKL